jgi:hypothetical protein
VLCTTLGDWRPTLITFELSVRPSVYVCACRCPRQGSSLAEAVLEFPVPQVLKFLEKVEKSYLRTLGRTRVELRKQNAFRGL